jgi:hypothetical protein
MLSQETGGEFWFNSAGILLLTSHLYLQSLDIAQAPEDSIPPAPVTVILL